MDQEDKEWKNQVEQDKSKKYIGMIKEMYNDLYEDLKNSPIYIYPRVGKVMEKMKKLIEEAEA